MNNIKLQALRKFLFLEVKEAAIEIADAEPRAWQRWEKGDRAVPDDVMDKMIELVKLRNSISTDAAIYIKDFDEFHSKTGLSKVLWRIHQSVVAMNMANEITDIQMNK